MNDHREALIKIMEICGLATTYTRRTQHINDVAMRALGMTANQRCAVHVEIIKRVGDVPQLDGYMKRVAKRNEHMRLKFGDGYEQQSN